MEIVLIAVLAFLLNLPLGLWRSRHKKFSFVWFVSIHASVPFLIALRIWLKTPHIYIPLFIALAVLGQLMGKKMSLCATKG